MIELVALTLGLVPVPLELVALEAEPVRPSQGQGFAGTILAAFLVIGLLALLAMFVSSKPRNRRRRR